MALRRIVKIDEEKFLRRKSREVEIFDSKLAEILKDMKETLLKEQGAGLAAPQIGLLKRVIVCQIDDKIIELVNPRVTTSSGEISDIEGCLSIPGKRGYVKRPAEVTVAAQDRAGKWFEITGKEYGARVLCHEIDHLDGVLYTDKAVKVENC